MNMYVRIGEAATVTGFSIKAIRYYEAAGLLPPPRRSEGRYRLYGEKDIRRLLLLKQARQLGFTLREAGELLNLADAGCCTIVRPGLRILLNEKLRQIDARIRDCQNLRSVLAAYADRLPTKIEQGDASCTPDCCIPPVEIPVSFFSKDASANNGAPLVMNTARPES